MDITPFSAHLAYGVGSDSALHMLNLESQTVMFPNAQPPTVRRTLSVTLVCAAAACLTACHRDRAASGPCIVPPITEPEDSVIVVPSEATPVCDVVLHEVVRLTGSVSSALPKPPITITSDGRYVTATYDPGRLAIWGQDGDLLGTFGRGPGDGPGEFGSPHQLLADSADVIWVFGLSNAHRYTLEGEYVGSLRFPAPAGTAGAALAGDSVVVSSTVTGGYPLLIATPRAYHAFGPATQRNAWVRVKTDGPDVWSSSDSYYEVVRHEAATGSIVFRLQREATWFRTQSQQEIRSGTPDAESPRGSLYDFAVDDRRLVWTTVHEVLRTPAPESPERGESLTHMEVLSLDGRLVASSVVDQSNFTHLADHLWYQVDDEDILRAVVILRGELTARRPTVE